MADIADRPRGILTPDDRRYLFGEKELTDESERNVRARIRERLFNSLLDFRLLWRLLEDRDLEQVFSPDDEREKHDLRPAVQDMFALAILGLRANDDHYSARIELAIEQAAFARDHSADASILVDEEPLEHPDVLMNRFMDDGLENYAEFEKALTSPNGNPTLLSTLLNRLGPEDEEISPQEVELYQSELEGVESRPTMPYLIKDRNIW